MYAGTYILFHVQRELHFGNNTRVIQVVVLVARYVLVAPVTTNNKSHKVQIEGCLTTVLCMDLNIIAVIPKFHGLVSKLSVTAILASGETSEEGSENVAPPFMSPISPGFPHSEVPTDCTTNF